MRDVGIVAGSSIVFVVLLWAIYGLGTAVLPHGVHGEGAVQVVALSCASAASIRTWWYLIGGSSPAPGPKLDR